MWKCMFSKPSLAVWILPGCGQSSMVSVTVTFLTRSFPLVKSRCNLAVPFSLSFTYWEITLLWWRVKNASNSLVWADTWIWDISSRMGNRNNCKSPWTTRAEVSLSLPACILGWLCSMRSFRDTGWWNTGIFWVVRAEGKESTVNGLTSLKFATHVTSHG